MATVSHFSLLLRLLLTITAAVHCKPTISATTSLYLSANTLFPDYHKMLDSFKIYVYPPPPPSSTGATVFTIPQQSQFYTSLLRSPFVTQNPDEAHLFFLPFPSSLSTRALARLVRTIRVSFPFWNRTLGADHFYLSAAGVGTSSDRDVVELKKNSVQISCFPTSSGLYFPHKDITLPPINPYRITLPVNPAASFLGYMKVSDGDRLSLIEEINGDPEFVVEVERSNSTANLINSSRFCLFVYGGDMTWMAEAMGLGCVPVVITDRPVQDLPLMDVIRWSDVAVFVAANGGFGGLKRVLTQVDEVRYEQMRESGVAATQHMVWNAEPQAYDAFHMVVYQLWLRRHTIRYARRERV